MARQPKPKTIDAVRPNVGIRIAYQRRLDAEIDAMHRDVDREVKSAYRANPPEMAQDASPATDMNVVMKRLSLKWRRRFNGLSRDLAAHFAKDVADRTDASLKAKLKKGGFTVEFSLTKAQNDIIQATVHENVALIKSIPEQYLTQVEGLVMRSVSAGRDLQVVSEGLQKQFGVTKRRAATIALSQNNMATAQLHRARQIDLGLECIWLHSAGGKVPRPSHVSNSGKPYDPKTGWYDPDEKVFCWPGSLINCRCVSKSAVPSSWLTSGKIV